MPTATLTVTPTTYRPGDTLTATYAVQGNDGTPEAPGVLSGTVTIGGQDVQVQTILTTAAVDPLPVTYSAPTAAGLTFTATADPAVWTATAP